jgi:hypothetical protein
MGEKRNRVLLGKPGGKRPLGRPRCRWMNTVNMDFRDEMGWYGMDWIDLVQDRGQWRPLLETVMKP